MAKKEESRLDKRLTIEVAYKMCDLIARALNGSNDKYCSDDTELLFKVCCQHRIAALVSTVIDPKCKGYNGTWDPMFRLSALRKKHMDTERGKLISFLRENDIWYLPMKGLVLEQLYPAPHLREMCDNDILYDGDSYELVKAFMLKNDYKTEHSSKSVHVDEYRKPPYINFDLHKNFFNFSRNNLAPYYNDIKRLLIPVDEYEMKLSNEDFYVYMTAHCYKHFIDGGTGIRSFVDCYLYNKKVEYNKDYVKAELYKLGITDFEERFSAMSDKLFSGGVPKLSENENETLLYVISSGAYGTKENYLNNKLKTTSKNSYLWSRLFPPLEWYKGHVPFCYKHRWAIPFYCVYRIFDRVLRHHKRIKNEIDIVKQIDK